jgi:hypothetical protein
MITQLLENRLEFEGLKDYTKKKNLIKRLKKRTGAAYLSRHKAQRDMTFRSTRNRAQNAQDARKMYHNATQKVSHVAETSVN